MDAGLNQTRMQMLGRFAEMAVVLAEDLQQSALMSGDADEKVRLIEAFHRVGRGLRQSLALHAKLEGDIDRAAREDELHLVKVGQGRRERRKAEIKGAVEALVWTEKERLDVDPQEAVDALDCILDAEAETAGFLDTDPQVFIRRLCKALGLDPLSLDRHGRPCAGHPETPTDLPPDADGAPASSWPPPAHLDDPRVASLRDPRGASDGPADDGREGRAEAAPSTPPPDG